MRIAASEHTSRPWRIREIAPDFRLEDVWALPGTGSAGDFDRLVDVVAAYDPFRSKAPVVRALFAVRDALGRLLRLDDDSSGVGGRVASLRDRLPADLRDRPPGPTFAAVPFTSLYRTDDEWAAEAA